MNLGKYSFGTGDRFGHQGKAQLKAILRAAESGVEITPVWNKSFREHQIIGTSPAEVRVEADKAVDALDYHGAYFVDADHVTMKTIEPFIGESDFFTLDVADYIGKPAEEDQLAKTEKIISELGNEVQIEGLKKPIQLTKKFVRSVLNKYLPAIDAASDLFEYIRQKKGDGNFVAEVSMDEVETAQTPSELLIILALLANRQVNLSTIAPKFTGRFNKGVDYKGEPAAFRNEFESDILVIRHAIANFGLPADLKLSVHSGSDKFSLYPIIAELIRKYDTGIHIKTAGTTWLEELIGLTMGDADSIAMVKDIYREAFVRQDELCAPYADVIDINKDALPANIDGLSGREIAQSLRHIPDNEAYNQGMRQLMHVAYKLAAERGESFISAIEMNAELIAHEVEENLFERHIRRIFLI